MIIADTCTLIWNTYEREQISRKASRILEEASAKNEIGICEISFWEIAILAHKKRLIIGAPYQKFVDLILRRHRCIPIGITPQIAEIAVNLPKEINSDPADRIIVATSLVKKAALVTSDKNLIKSKLVKTIW